MDTQPRAYAAASTVVPRTATEIWSVIRDFNNYPEYIASVVESVIEDDLSGTTVGAVRRFRMGSTWIRQRLVALSDPDRTFSYTSVGPLVVEDAGVARELTNYTGTVRLRGAANGCFAEWSATYQCPPVDVDYWAAWWDRSIPEWLADLRARFTA